MSLQSDEKRIQKRMKQACDLATKSVCETGCGPFGCVITNQEDEVIGSGHNRVTLDNDPTQHAEIVAIRDACKTLSRFDLTGSILYTSCEPCPMCLSAIYWAHIDKVYYGNTKQDAKGIGFDDAFIYQEFEKPKSQMRVHMMQVEAEYAKMSFTEWSKKENKISY